MRIRTLIKQAFRYFGFDIRPLTSVPYGVNWRWDVRSIMNGLCPECIIDIGANQGQTALKIATEFPSCKVYSFEPVRSTYEMLCINVGAVSNITPLNSAVGESVGTIEITDEPGSGTNTTILQRDTSEVRTVSVSVTTVDDFCTQYSIQQVDLLKIDVEGGEHSVLKGAERMIKDGKIRAILAECEFSPRVGEPHGLFDDVWMFLRENDYRVCGFYSGGVDRNGWIWGDCLFVRVGEGPESVVCSPWATRSRSHLA